MTAARRPEQQEAPTIKKAAQGASDTTTSSRGTSFLNILKGIVIGLMLTTATFGDQNKTLQMSATTTSNMKAHAAEIKLQAATMEDLERFIDDL